MSAVWSEISKVDKDLVHKDFEDDLLVCDGRGPIPTVLSESLMELPALAARDKVLLIENYAACTHADCKFAEQGRHLHLRSVPARIKKDVVLAVQGDEELRDYVSRNYEEDDDAYLLKVEYMHESDEVAIARAFCERRAKLSDSMRCRLSEVIDRLPIAETRPHIYYVTMFNDTKNYFFYRKHHEHVPGMMLIEVARQAMYAQFYKYSGHKRADVTLTIDFFAVDFMNFVDANYPVRVAVEIPTEPFGERFEKGTGTVERDFRVATFYQHNKVVAVARLGGTLIKVALFKRLRNVIAARSHRFIPVKGINQVAILIDAKGNRQEAHIRDLSMRGLNASLPAECNFDLSEPVDFFFFADSIGFVHGTALKRWTVVKDQSTVLGMEVTTLNKKDEVRLREIIKNYTHVVTSREVF